MVEGIPELIQKVDDFKVRTEAQIEELTLLLNEKCNTIIDQIKCFRTEGSDSITRT